MATLSIWFGSRMAMCAFLVSVACIPFAPARAAGIERIWLTPTSGSPLRVVVSWETDQPGNSAVELTLPKSGDLEVQLKNLEGHTLDSIRIAPRRIQ